MTHPTVARKRLGVIVITVSIFLTLYGAYSVHKETKLLHERQDVVSAVIRSDDYPLAIMDDKGNVIQWNDGMEKLTGVSAETAIRDGISSVVCDPLKLGHHKEGLAKAFADTANRGKLLVILCDVQNAKTGVHIPVRVSMRIVETQGKLYAVGRMDRESEIETIGCNSAAPELNHGI